LIFAFALAVSAGSAWAHDDDDGSDDGGGPCKDQPAGVRCEKDGDKCTLEKCDGKGACVPDDVVECIGPVGQCDGGKVCDPDTGECKDRPDKPVGTVCERDRNKCTPDKCNDRGFCVPAGPPVACHGPGQCDGGKECDPTTGQCTINLPEVPAGTPCEVDRNKCTTDACNGKGFCIKGPVKDCDDEDVCTDDACDEDTGACSNVEDPTNDPICTPGADLAVTKSASCVCKDDSGPDALGLGAGVAEDNIVFCTKESAPDGQTGCAITFAITVDNVGDGSVSGVFVSDLLPDTVTFVGANPSQGLYDLGTGSWDVGALGSAGSALLTLDVAIPSSPGGALIDVRNCANLAGSDPADGNAENDESCVIVKPTTDVDRSCADDLPPRVVKALRRCAAIVAAAAGADSPERAARLARKASRALERAARKVARLGGRGVIDDACLDQVGAAVASLASDARRLAP
jgi:uncharacterized repeat protein (TIGR01451 family)